jgi:hypothetical protein
MIALKQSKQLLAAAALEVYSLGGKKKATEVDP